MKYMSQGNNGKSLSWKRPRNVYWETLLEEIYKKKIAENHSLEQ